MPAHFARPILLPVSRKTVIGDVLGIANPAERDNGRNAHQTEFEALRSLLGAFLTRGTPGDSTIDAEAAAREVA